MANFKIVQNVRSHIMKKTVLFIYFLITIVTINGVEVTKVEIPKIDTLLLEPVGHIDFKDIDESSALVKSRQYENVYWTLNDSGNDERIFVIDKFGKTFIPYWAENYRGIEIGEATNVDWEDIAVDDNGNLIIGAFGNNYSLRKDLALYILKEPYYPGITKTRAFQRIDFAFPDQTTWPDTLKRFDCEAVFTKLNNIYILTKHRKDPYTHLYRFDTMYIDKINIPKLIGIFEINGEVTAADCSLDGNKLAVLTYNNIWCFEVEEGDDFFNGKISYLPIKAKQCEGITFDEDTLILTNEQRDVFHIKIDQLIKIK